MLEQAIVEQNPHWDGTLYPPTVPRDVLRKAISLLELPHVISIVGVRRAGKSTLTKQLINHLLQEKKIHPRNILSLNLEHPTFAKLRSDVANLDLIYNIYLKLAMPNDMVYCILDEVHFFSDWEVFVKSRYEMKKIKFIITSSNSKLIDAEFLTLLSGRTLAVEVYPLSFKEFVIAKGINPVDKIALLKDVPRYQNLFDEYLKLGGFPEICFVADPLLKKEIVTMYARNILFQDIATRFKIKKPYELESLFFYLVANIGSLYTFNHLTQLVNINDKTIKKFLKYFAESYLLFTVNCFSFAVKKQANSPKKIYAIDSGMVNATAFSFSENIGHLMENAVYLHLKRTAQNIFYYRTKQNYEVDFLLFADQKPQQLIQVTKSMTDPKIRERELRGLFQALIEMGLEQGTIVTYNDEETIVRDKKTVRVIPAFKYFLE